MAAADAFDADQPTGNGSSNGFAAQRAWGAPEDTDGHQRARRRDRWRSAAGALDARVWPGRMRQDAARHGVPRAGDHAVRRAGSVRGVRGDRRRLDVQRRIAGFRSHPTRGRREARRRSRLGGPRGDGRDRRLGPGRVVRADRRGDRQGRRQTGRDRHDRDPVRSVLEHGDPAVRAAPPVRLAQGTWRHVGDHRRARRRHAHEARHRGVRLGLRDRPRPPCDRADVDPAAANPEVPGFAPRDQRVPVPDRRDRCLGAADHLTRRPPRRVGRTGVHRRRPSRLDAR